MLLYQPCIQYLFFPSALSVASGELQGMERSQSTLEISALIYYLQNAVCIYWWTNIKKRLFFFLTDQQQCCHSNIWGSNDIKGFQTRQNIQGEKCLRFYESLSCSKLLLYFINLIFTRVYVSNSLYTRFIFAEG